MTITLLSLIVLYTTFEYDKTTPVLNFFSNLLTGFNNISIDLIIYQIAQSISVEVTSNSCFGYEFTLSITTAFNNALLSFIASIGSYSSDLDLNFTETGGLILGCLISFILVGFDDITNDMYNKTIGSYLWFVLGLIEGFSFLLRSMSLSIRLSANTLAGHILLSILTISSIILIEWSTQKLSQIIIVISIIILLAVQIMELMIVLIQFYVWLVLSITYGSTLN